MEYHLLTKEECDLIVEKSEAFYRADREVEGCNVAIYDYRLASLSDFVDNKAFELRGLCFVEQENGSWQRNLLMQKFFNIGQTSMDDLWEVTVGDSTLKVNETHLFHLANGKKKFARDLKENDDIVGWDNLTEQ